MNCDDCPYKDDEGCVIGGMPSCYGAEKRLEATNPTDEEDRYHEIWE